MSDTHVRLERQGHLALLTLDRQERRNALNEPMWLAFDEALEAIEASPPRAVILTGAGDKAFCAGMDVNADNPQIARLVGAVQKRELGPAMALLEQLRPITDRLANLPVPTIAAINGLAYGGGAEIAIRCDLRVADPSALICFSEVRLGLMPDIGGGVDLTRLVGPAKAADLILTARKLGADEALALGVVNRVSQPGQVVAEAMALGEAIAANGPRAVRFALEVIRRTPDMSAEAALAFEMDGAAHLIASGECTVGIPAFLSRTKPQFVDPD